MSSQTPTPDLPVPLTPGTSDDGLAELAEDFLDAVLSAASVDVIGVSRWWDRATSALVAAGARATCLRDMVTVAAGKLQVENLSEAQARTVVRIEALLADPVVFARWRRICERDAIYITAMVRLRRVEKRETRKDAPAKTTAPKPEPMSEEPMF